MAVLAEVKKDYGKIKNFVNGEWIDSKTSKFMDVVNPATTDVIAKVPMSTRDETSAAIEAAQEAWWSWRETPPISRGRLMFNLKTIMERDFEDIARIISQEQGKTIDDARGETRRAIENVEVAAGVTSLMMGYNLEDGAAANIDEEVIISPLGVFGAICPFNFPGMVPFWFWPYAVATGNTYVIKPSEQVPLTTMHMVKLIEEAGFPPGVVNLVNGREDAVNTMLEHPSIKGISFVGSTPVAKYIYKKCGETGKRVQAQGGAKNSLVDHAGREARRECQEHARIVLRLRGPEMPRRLEHARDRRHRGAAPQEVASMNRRGSRSATASTRARTWAPSSPRPPRRGSSDTSRRAWTRARSSSSTGGTSRCLATRRATSSGRRSSTA